MYRVQLLCNRGSREIAHQAIEMHSLLILQLITTLSQNMHLNLCVHLLESIAHFRCGEDALTLAPNHYYDRHLQTRRSLVRIHV